MDIFYVLSSSIETMTKNNHEQFVFLDSMHIKPKQMCIVFPVYNSTPQDHHLFYQHFLHVYNDSKNTFIFNSGDNLSLLTSLKDVHYLISSTPALINIDDDDDLSM